MSEVDLCRLSGEATLALLEVYNVFLIYVICNAVKRVQLDSVIL